MGKKQLGDYVHLKRENYVKYGINAKWDGMDSSLYSMAAYAKQKNNLQTLVMNRGRDDAAESLQNVLNEFIPKLQFDDIRLNWEEGYEGTKAIKATSEALKNYFDEESANFVVDLDKFAPTSVIRAEDYENIKKEIKGNIPKTYDKKGNRIANSVLVKTLERRITGLSDYLNKLEEQIKSFNKGTVKYNQLNDTAQKVKEMISELTTVIREAGDSSMITRDNNIDALIQEYKNLRHYLLIPSNTLIGNIGEYGTSALIYLASNQINDKSNIMKMLKDANVGRNSSITGVGKGGFLDVKILEEGLNKDVNGKVKKIYERRVDPDTGYEYLVTNNSPQTVDISISIPEGSYLYNETGIEQLNASVKNYNLGKVNGEDVSLISGSPLSSLLSLMDTDFANHYLNLIAVFEDNNITESYFNDYQEMVKRTLFVRSITGETGHYDGPKSDYFIMHDTGKGALQAPYKVYSTNNLYNRVDINNDLTIKGLPESHSLANDYVNAEGFSPKLNGKLSANRQAAIKRITNLVVETHKCKLYLTLKRSFFTKG